MRIELPFPPSSLSGHANGNWRGKSSVTATWRALAHNNTRLARHDNGGFDLPERGDIYIHFRFEPPDNRSDRLNFPNRVKPIADGIAEALGVDDKRFLPSYEFLPAVKGGRLTVIVEPLVTISEFG